MRYKKHVLLLILSCCWHISSAYENHEDMLLQKIISAYGIEAHKPARMSFGPKEKLGRALFFDPLLSGPRNIACATCHVRSKGSGDGIPLAVGLGAVGVGQERLKERSAFVIPRNTLPLFNRGSEDFVDFFWDGRVQYGPGGIFESPLGNRLPEGFDNLLAVASVFPLVEADEMLGHSARRVGAAFKHGDLVTIEGVDNNYQERALNAFGNIVKRVIQSRDHSKPKGIIEYRELIEAAYPNVPLKSLTIAHIGNALAAYIKAAFELQSAPWDRYVLGNVDALSLEQKRGAILFFGKGRCVVCHSGKQFSDFLFHGVAIPQYRVGKHTPYIDYGRAAASGRAEDRYLFRTPPLRNVTKTAPWGHNGVFESLRAIVEHHENPIPLLYEAQQKDDQLRFYSGRLLASRSGILSEIYLLSDQEIKQLTAFLESLTSKTVIGDQKAVPLRVPSGDNSFIPHNGYE